MFGFLKGKNKEKNNLNQEVNEKHLAKIKSKKRSNEKKDRQNGRQNDSDDPSLYSNRFFRKSKTLPRQVSLQDRCANNHIAVPQQLSNGACHHSSHSLDRSSSTDVTNASEVSELYSKSSSCRNSYTLSNSSSRASIPSITTEFIDDSTSLNPVDSTNTLCTLAEHYKPENNPVGRPVIQPNHLHYKLETTLSNHPPISKSHLGIGLAMKPPIIPRSSSSMGAPPVARASSNEDDTSIGSSVYSAPSSPGFISSVPNASPLTAFSAGVSTAPVTYDRNSTYGLTYGFFSSRPTSPEEGKMSMVNTPSSSTSSLSSLSLGLASPSGGRNSSGPRMGTSVKLGNSPTPSRKATRTNIKTNPNVLPASQSKFPSAAKNSDCTPLLDTDSTKTFLNMALLSSTDTTNGCFAASLSDTKTQHVPSEQIFTVIEELESAPDNEGCDDIPVVNPPSVAPATTGIRSLQSISENKHINQINNDKIKCNDVSNDLLPDKTKNNFENESALCIVSNSFNHYSNALSLKTAMDDYNLLSSGNKTDDSPADVEVSTQEDVSLVSETDRENKSVKLIEDYADNRNDEDSSDSVREPEIKEHRLELIPNSINMKNNITFTTDKTPLSNSQKLNTLQSATADDRNDKSLTEAVSNSDPDSSLSLSPHSEEATHAVFQIPLRSKSRSLERISPPRCVISDSSVAGEIENAVTFSNMPLCSKTKSIKQSTDFDESSTVQCVEGHVELNFDRGRTDQRTPKVSRRRSTSSARRQKLYEDIKKFTAQTKEMQLQPTKRKFSRQSSTGDIDEKKKTFLGTDNFAELNRRLKGEGGQSSSDSVDTNCARPNVKRMLSNTLPRASTKRLERSITVAEIKINVNNNQFRSVHNNGVLNNEEGNSERIELNEEKCGAVTDTSSLREHVPVRPNRSKVLVSLADGSKSNAIEPLYNSVSKLDRLGDSGSTACAYAKPSLSGMLNVNTPSNITGMCNNVAYSINKDLLPKLVHSSNRDSPANLVHFSNSGSPANEEQYANRDTPICENTSDVEVSNLQISNPFPYDCFEETFSSELSKSPVVHTADQPHPRTPSDSVQCSAVIDSSRGDRSEGVNSRESARKGSVGVERSQQLQEEGGSALHTVTLDHMQKELASVEAKYQVQVEQLTLALTQKQGELSKCKAEAERTQKQFDERRKKDQEEFKERLIKEKTQLEEKHTKDIEERNRKELEEREKRKKEEADKAVQTSELPCNAEESKRGRNEEEESEAESNKRKLEVLNTEVLVLRQQNEQFEELVRQKHRCQMELELQVAENAKEALNKESIVESIKVELTQAKHETELSKAGERRMEAEVTEYKEKIEALEQEVDASERELKRMEILQEKLRVTETKRNELQVQIDEIETERDEEIKIIQDALDEAAQEREELLLTFEKEIEKLNSVNAAREAQMLEDFENKLRELEQQHKRRIEEKEAEVEGALHRGKRQHDNEESRQKLDKMKSELNSEWEDKLRSECARLKGELDALHAEEKHLAVETIKVQKDQELQTIKKNFEVKAEDMAKEISSLKDTLSSKDSFYHKELDDLRTRADRDVWELRRKLQKLDEASYDRQQHLEDKHREDMERLREEYVDRTAGLEAQLASVDVRGLTDLRAQLEQRHKEQMEHLGEQHRLSMERLRDELEAEKFQAAEEARVIVTKHHEYVNSSLRDQLTEAITANTQYRDEIEAIRFALSRREEVIRSLEEDVAKLRSSKGGSSPPGYGGTSPPGYGGTSPPGYGSSSQSQSPPQFLHEGSQGSRNSQDRLSNEGPDDEGHRGSGLLGKVFGGGWFSGAKTKEGGGGPGTGGPAVSSKKPRTST